MNTIGWEDFTRVELRVGRIIDARPFPEARNEAGRVALCVPDKLVPLGTKLL